MHTTTTVTPLAELVRIMCNSKAARAHALVDCRCCVDTIIRAVPLLLSSWLRSRRHQSEPCTPSTILSVVTGQCSILQPCKLDPTRTARQVQESWTVWLCSRSPRRILDILAGRTRRDEDLSNPGTGSCLHSHLRLPRSGSYTSRFRRPVFLHCLRTVT
jgi:hypothetical protein